MKRMILVGRTGSGKTTLIQAIYNLELNYRKTQAVEFYSNIIDTPGEYIENRFYYKAIIVSFADSDLIAFVQSCTDEECIFPPNFASIFAKPVIGIITKTDCRPKDIEKAKKCLNASGAQKIYLVSSINGEGIDDIRSLMS
jgi:ethanolamine utilization protein EutP